MSWHKPAKRQRAGELGLITPLRRPMGLSTASSDQSARPDAGATLFDMLADRAQARSDRDAELLAMQRAQEQQAAALDEAKFQIAKLEADAVQAQVRAAVRTEEQAQRIAVLESRLEQEAREAARTGAKLADATRRLEQSTQGPSPAPVASSAVVDDATGLRAECASLRSALAEARLAETAAREEAEAAARRAEHAVQELAASSEAAEAERSRLCAALVAAQAEASEAVEAAERRRAPAECHAAAKAETGDTAREDDEVLLRTLRERLDAAETAAAAVPGLRAAAADAAASRERATAAESRSAQLRELLAAADEAAAAGAAAAETLRTWRVALSDVGGARGPAQVIAALAAAQDEAAAQRAARGDADAAAAAAAAEAAAARNSAAESRARLEAALEDAERREAALARVTRRAELLAGERESLRAVLASYDEEYLAQRPEAGIGPQAERLAAAEATLEGLHAHVLDLEAELERRDAAAVAAGDNGDNKIADGAAVETQASGSTLTALKERCDAAERGVAGLERELESVRAAHDSLAARLGRGEYDPARTRVLHLRANPEAELARAARDADVERLESENAALARAVARLEAVGTGAGAEAAATTAVSSEVGVVEPLPPPSTTASPLLNAAVNAAPPCAHAAPDPASAVGPAQSASLRAARLESEVSLLRARVASLEKASDRLQAVFRRQITAFREAVYLLFGYRVEMASDPSRRDVRARFHLTPQHAPATAGAGGGLVFDLMRSGELVLMPTALTESALAREAATYIGRFGSVPAFTANLTLENFQRQATQG